MNSADDRQSRLLRSIVRLVSWLLTAASLVIGVPKAAGQSAAELGLSDPLVVQMQQQTAARLLTPVERLELDGQSLRDVVRFIAELTQADLTPLWITDRRPDGLDPEAQITLKARDTTALGLLEMVLDRADREAGRSDVEASTWQFTRYGGFEFGPRPLLNRRQRLAIYDVQDLLFIVPDYDEIPDFDLNSVVSQAGQGGGGGGQSPFQSTDQDPERPTQEELVEELIDVIQRFVEPDQWEAAGGDGGSIEFYRGALMVRGADYIHRQLIGYSWWPGGSKRVTAADGSRRMTLDDRGVDLGALAGRP